MNLDNWPQSGVVLPIASHLQQAVDALRELDARRRIRGQQPIDSLQYLVGLISDVDPLGNPSTLTSEQYWVKPLIQAPTGLFAPLNFAPDPTQYQISPPESQSSPPRITPVLVTNLAELPPPSQGVVQGGSGTHQLPAGRVVIYWQDFDNAGNLHYVMDVSPGMISTGNITGPIVPGIYTLNLFTGAPSGNMSGNLTLPDSGETIGNTTVAWENVPEDGLGTNWVGNGTKVSAFPTGGTLVSGNVTYPVYRGAAPNLWTFPVALTWDGGGSDGTGGASPTQASWTYTVADLNGVTLGTSMQPIWAREYGSIAKATHGLGYWSGNRTFVLYIADEVENVVGCPGT